MPRAAFPVPLPRRPAEEAPARAPGRARPAAAASRPEPAALRVLVGGRRGGRRREPGVPADAPAELASELRGSAAPCPPPTLSAVGAERPSSRGGAVPTRAAGAPWGAAVLRAAKSPKGGFPDRGPRWPGAPPPAPIDAPWGGGCGRTLLRFRRGEGFPKAALAAWTTCQVTKGNVGGTTGETGNKGLRVVVRDPLPSSPRSPPAQATETGEVQASGKPRAKQGAPPHGSYPQWQVQRIIRIGSH